MNKKIPFELTQKELTEIAAIIAKPSFKYMNKKIEREVRRIQNYERLGINSFINIVLLVIVSMSVNKLNDLAAYFKAVTGQDIDLHKLTVNFIANLTSNMSLDKETLSKTILN